MNLEWNPWYQWAGFYQQSNGANTPPRTTVVKATVTVIAQTTSPKPDAKNDPVPSDEEAEHIARELMGEARFEWLRRLRDQYRKDGIGEGVRGR